VALRLPSRIDTLTRIVRFQQYEISPQVAARIVKEAAKILITLLRRGLSPLWEMSVERNLAVSVATIGAMRVGLKELSDRETIRHLAWRDRQVLAHESAS